MRWLKRLGVGLLLLAPIAVVVAVGASQTEEGVEVLEPVELQVAIGPHDTTVRIRPDFGGFCVELEAADRGTGSCGPIGGGLGFVLPFGGGEGDAEFAAAGLAPPEAASVRFVPDEGEPVAGELQPLDGRDELLFTAYWSVAAVAPEPPRLEILDAAGAVLLEL